MRRSTTCLALFAALLVFQNIEKLTAQEVLPNLRTQQILFGQRVSSTAEAYPRFTGGETGRAGSPLTLGPATEYFVPPLNAGAHALWALGVQIGFAELGSNRNIETALLQESLALALDAAKQLDCIPEEMIARIETLEGQMRNAGSSRSLYSEILALRVDMANVVNISCLCDVGHTPTSTNGFLGSWVGEYKNSNMKSWRKGSFRVSVSGDQYRASFPAGSIPCERKGNVLDCRGTMSGRYYEEVLTVSDQAVTAVKYTAWRNKGGSVLWSGSWRNIKRK